MKNIIKEHVDKLFRKHLKTAVDKKFDQHIAGLGGIVDSDQKKEIKGKIRKEIKKGMEKAYGYGSWLERMLSQNINGVYFPSNQAEGDLLQLLNLEVLYKRTFKSACDEGHPIIKELLEDIKIGDELIDRYMEKAKLYDSEPLSYYLLFQKELDSGDFCLDNVCSTVDKLADDCRHGTIVSHPAKMTNPDCRFPKIFALSEPSLDGFIRTGNAEVDFDIHINAVNLKVFKFLSLKYKGKTLLEYIKNEDIKVFMELFIVDKDRATTWVENFSICITNEDTRINKHIRQVYFPVGDTYHTLSILTPSGLVFSLKDKLNTINNRSPKAYLGKKLRKENKYGEYFSSIQDLTETRHGGEHPKNISGLNNKYQSYYLLLSAPPTLQKRNIRFPRHNFFGESFRYFECRDTFQALHKLFMTDYNNKRIREGRDYRLQDMMERIIDKMWAVRAVAAEQYYLKGSNLKPHQRIWLCEEFRQVREEEDAWLDTLCKEITVWIIRAYEKVIGKHALKVDESIRRHIYGIVAENREGLR